MTVPQALHEYIAQLELTPNQVDAVSRQHTFLRDQLASRVPIHPGHGAFLSGSYARNTAIRPLHDVDVFLVLREENGWSRSRSPAETLQRLQAEVSAIYHAHKTVRVQGRSVNVEFTGTGVGYDVVPAFVVSPDEYCIPDLRRGAWIRTNPKRHKELSTDHNERSGKYLKPLTKAVKAWKARQPEQQQPRSFHLEVMGWTALRSPPDSQLDGLIRLFEGFAAKVSAPTPEPCQLGPAIDEDLNVYQRQDHARRFQATAEKLREAQRLARGSEREAHTILRGLFGDDYPGR